MNRYENMLYMVNYHVVTMCYYGKIVFIEVHRDKTPTHWAVIICHIKRPWYLSCSWITTQALSSVRGCQQLQTTATRWAECVLSLQVLGVAMQLFTACKISQNKRPLLRFEETTMSTSWTLTISTSTSPRRYGVQNSSDDSDEARALVVASLDALEMINQRFWWR